MKVFKRFFSLIELIVVIVVLGILASIVIPNISSFKEDATTAGIQANGKNIQTGVDMYIMEKGENPTWDGKPAFIGNPKQVDFLKLTPEHLRSEPLQGYYWIDYKGEVIYSDTDAPTGIEQDEETLNWVEPAQGKVQGYIVYSVGEKVTGAAKSREVQFLAETKTTQYVLSEKEKGYDDYLVASVSTSGFISPGINGTSEYKGIDLEKLPDGESEQEVIPSPVQKTPSVFSSVSNLQNLSSYSAANRSQVFNVGENTEVYYSTSSPGALIIDTFDKDGVRISTKTVTGYSGNDRSISDLDEEENRYIFTLNGDIHKLSPEGTAVRVANMATHFKILDYRIRKPGIKVEGDIAYLSYLNNDTRQHHMAIYNMKTRQLISNKVFRSGSISGWEKSNIIITEDYVYTSLLNGYEDEDSDLFLFKWDKHTGNPLISYVHNMPSSRYKSAVMFMDTAGGLWFSESRTFTSDKVPVKLHRMNLETFKSIDKTVTLPELNVFPYTTSASVNEDGSVDLFYVMGTTFRKISFE